MHDLTGLKLLARLRLELSHLNEHNFNNNFRECMNPLCPCSLEIDYSSHFCLHCHYHANVQKTLLHKLQSVDENNLNQSENKIAELYVVRNSISNTTVVY